MNTEAAGNPSQLRPEDLIPLFPLPGLATDSSAGSCEREQKRTLEIAKGSQVVRAVTGMAPKSGCLVELGPQCLAWGLKADWTFARKKLKGRGPSTQLGETALLI